MTAAPGRGLAAWWREGGLRMHEGGRCAPVPGGVCQLVSDWAGPPDRRSSDWQDF